MNPCLSYNFRKYQRNEVIISSRKCNSVIKDGKLARTRVKLTNTQLNKSKYAARTNAGTILRLIKKKFEDEELVYELFLTTNKQLK